VSGGSGSLRVAIVGAGPAGSALGVLLAQAGARVTLFDDDRRPELLVGESLVPAIMPILERLGIDRETATFSCVKPGVSFIWSPTDRVGFTFARFAPAVPAYAYNIPRPQFDEALLARAVASGVERVVTRALLQPTGGGATEPELALAPETLAAAPGLGGRQPDLIVDATGRVRLGARALGIQAHVGPRKDVAHFAHFENFQWDAAEAPGQVLIRRLPSGWSWCIPLQDRLSVGIVVDRDTAARLGPDPAERLERAIADDPWLSGIAAAAKRVTSVATYSNYQLISHRMHGCGWVMVGDAAGFVDPMLSPGVFLAVRSAELVAAALAPFQRRGVTPSPAEAAAALHSYEREQSAMLAAWAELIGYFYDGRLLALVRAGREWVAAGPGFLRPLLQRHIERRIALQATGVGTRSRYSRALLRFLGRYGLRGVDPADMVIR
jgi:flavin-dependent dehydrogenase